jgi:tRNA nucleotidyltransferase (CCA-adding enzyme)
MTLLQAFENEMGQGGIAIVRQLTDAGYAAYFVGGCVRDVLLGRAMKDIDIATSARPEQTLQLFPEGIPTGLQHGTVTIPKGGWPYEVTTFRTESDYSDGRRPDNVAFITDVAGDLERRDFTMNAMAVGLDGELIDPFGGRKDMEAGVLRAVGNASERFQEDALRMLRCVRFAAEYRLTVETSTWSEVRLGAPGLSHIAMERVFAELDRMIGGADPHRALLLLRESELLRWSKQRLRFPRSLGISNEADVPDPLARLPILDDPVARWALWFVCMELGPTELMNACKALRTPNAFIASAAAVTSINAMLLGAPSHACRSAWITAVLRYGVEEARRWLSLARAMTGHPGWLWVDLYTEEAEKWIGEMGAKDLKELCIRGSDVMAKAGRKGGPWVRDVLDKLLRETALGQISNEEGALLERAVEILGQLHGRKR